MWVSDRYTVAETGRRGRTFPHRLILLGRLPRWHSRTSLRRCAVNTLAADGEHRLVLRANCARNTRGAVRERGKVDAHEAEDHVVCDVWRVEADHVRRVEDLRGAREQAWA